MLAAIFSLVAGSTMGPKGEFLPGLLTAIRDDDELAEALRVGVIDPIRERIRAELVLVLGADHPQIDLLVDLVPGVCVFRALAPGETGDPDEQVVAAVMALVTRTGRPSRSLTWRAGRADRSAAGQGHRGLVGAAVGAEPGDGDLLAGLVLGEGGDQGVGRGDLGAVDGDDGVAGRQTGRGRPGCRVCTRTISAPPSVAGLHLHPEEAAGEVVLEPLDDDCRRWRGRSSSSLAIARALLIGMA